MKNIIDKIHDTIVMLVIILSYLGSITIVLKYIIDVYNDCQSNYLLLGGGILLAYGIAMSIYFIKINSK